MWYDATYILVLIGALISLIASWNVNATFRQYDRQYSKSGLTSQEAARRILSAAGISDVEIGRISGNLTDHYSPGEKILRLSDSVMGSSSVAAIGVAAHECGHAIQHKQGYDMDVPKALAVHILQNLRVDGRIHIPDELPEQIH